MENLGPLTTSMASISLNEDESFLFSNIESQELVTLENRTDLGRVIVATKDAAVGTKIFREDPILVYEAGNIEDMVLNFLALDTESRDAVLKMHHPPVLSPTALALGLYIANEMSVDQSLVHKLIGIDRCNSREYHGSEQEIYFHTQSALFLFASKVTHACNPNTVLTLSKDGGRIQCRVIRPIQSGDIVTYALFGEMVKLPFHLKHKVLLHEKETICRCPQCIGPDYSRPIYCRKCRGGILLCTSSQEGHPTWKCSVCGGLQQEESRIESLEMEAIGDLEFLMILKEADNPMFSKSAVKEKIETYAQKLHPQHYVIISFVIEFVELCISDAMAIEIMPMLGFHPVFTALAQRDMGSPVNLHSEAATMVATLIERVECIAAGCICPTTTAMNTSGGCDQNAPVPYAVKYALVIAKLMMQCPSSTWPANGRHIVHRYLPIMKELHDGEIIIDDIKRRIPAPTNHEGEGLPVAVQKRAKQRRKKRGRKKGRKR